MDFYLYLKKLSEKKSQDRKEDRIENPEGSQDQSGFLLYDTDLSI